MKMWESLDLQMMIRFQRVNLGFPKLLILNRFHCFGKKKKSYVTNIIIIIDLWRQTFPVID